MLRVLVDSELDKELSAPPVVEITGLGADPEVLDIDGVMPLGAIDAVVAGDDRMHDLCSRFEESTRRRPAFVILMDAPDVDCARRLLAGGAGAIVDSSRSTAAAQALVVLAAATGVCACIPAWHGVELATRLEAPPRELAPTEEALLGLAASQGIEAAGEALGLSRRQAQRRFKQLCVELSLDNHRLAAILSARWGVALPSLEPADKPSARASR